MKKILVPLADGFEEIETMTIVDVLRRAGLEVVIAGIKAGELTGAHGVRVIPDMALEAVKNKEFDVIILPGGQPGVDNLRKNPTVLEILQKMNQKKKMIGAICAAPLALRDAGLIAGRRFTSYPGFEKELQAGRHELSSVVVDGNLVTSRGPGTAMEFALKLVELLCDEKKAASLSGALLAG